MDKMQRLYIFTLEVDQLTVGKRYNPLPSHLTLVTRFFSTETPERIATIVNPLFARTNSLELLFEETVLLGPNHTAVDLVKSTKELLELHEQLITLLESVHATYTHPQFVGAGWKPHVSKRSKNNFKPGDCILISKGYLIEIKISSSKSHVRHIRARFNLAS